MLVSKIGKLNTVKVVNSPKKSTFNGDKNSSMPENTVLKETKNSKKSVNKSGKKLFLLA